MTCVSFLAFLAATILPHTLAQCPNDFAKQYPKFRTMSANNTWFLVPVPITSVKAAMSESYNPLVFSGANRLSLLPLPAALNIPLNTHPVLVASGYDSDIRQDKLQIDGPLLGSNIMVPFVGTGGSTTPFNAPLISHLAGTSEATNKYLATLIPTIVATLVGGLPSRIGAFLPDNAAWQITNGLLSANSKFTVIPNQVSGPGVYIEALDLLFSTTSAPAYSLQTWKSIINQPYILNVPLAGRCMRNTYYFNRPTAGVEFRIGRVIFGAAAGLNTETASLQKSMPGGVYESVQGVSACVQLVGYGELVGVGEECEDAARKVGEDGDAL